MASSKVIRHLLMLNKINEVMKCAPHDNNGNVMLMAQKSSRILFCIWQLNKCSNHVFLDEPSPGI